MKFLLDMGISTRTLSWLKDQEHDAIHLSNEGLHKLSDLDILIKGYKEGRIIVTADMDFGTLLATHPEYETSVIQFRVSDFSPDNIIEKLSLIFNDFNLELSSPRIITVKDHQIRIRKLPI